MPHDLHILRALCQGHEPWQQIRIVAARQGRTITTEQLTGCEISRHTVATAVRNRHLHQIHRGVYAVGLADLDVLGRNWAAHLAAGPMSALADVSGAATYGWLGWRGAVHLAVPTHRRTHGGVVLQQVSCLSPQIVTSRRGLSVMRPQHVLLDLAAHLCDDALALALNEALATKAVSLEALDEAIALRPRHRGRRALATQITAAGADPGQGRTASELEDLVLLLLRDLPGLPPYRRNALLEIGGGRLAKADLLFPQAQVMVELDSRTWHDQRAAMDSDRRRDQQALAVGLVTFRITWRHATREWAAVSQDLLAALGQSASRTAA